MNSTTILDNLFLSAERHIADQLLSEDPMISEDAENIRRKALSECLKVEQDCETEFIVLGKARKLIQDLKDRYCEIELKKALTEKEKNQQLTEKYQLITSLLEKYKIGIPELNMRLKRIQENEAKKQKIADEILSMKAYYEVLKKSH